MTEQEKVDIGILQTEVRGIHTFMKDDLKPFMKEQADLIQDHEGRLKQLEGPKAKREEWVGKVTSSVAAVGLVAFIGWLLYMYHTHSPK